MIDRFDLKFPFRDIEDPKQIKDLAKKLTEILDKEEKGQLPDYKPFLVKYLQFAREINPILNEGALIMLNNFFEKIRINKFGSNRVLITLHKISKAIARLKLKEIVDEDDAEETMEFYNIMLLDFQKSVIVSKSPRDIAYLDCIELLKQAKEFGGISFEELVLQVCKGNENLKSYFGYDRKRSLKLRDNKKVRMLYDMLLNHSNINIIHEKPVVFQWIEKKDNVCDPCDLCDPTQEIKRKINDTDYNYSNTESEIESRSHMAHGSHSNDNAGNDNYYNSKIENNYDVNSLIRDEN